MWNSNRWLSVIRKDKPQFFLSSFPTHFYSYSCDVPTSKFGISIRRTEFFTGFLKFLRWAVCVGEISSRVYFDELFRALCQGGELIFQRVKGIFKFEMWFIDRRESVSLCLPGCSSLLSWNSMFFDKDIPLSMIPDFLFHVLYSCHAAICHTCSLNKNWNFRKKFVPFEKFKFRNIEKMNFIY